MLREIRLQNYTIIDDLSLTFSDGFSIITGETGAGKSILVEALALLLGGESNADAVRHETNEATLEARFDPPEFILKRILSRSKGRSYVNGSFANIAALKEVGANLAEIHGQHDTHLLTHQESQLALLDAYAQNADQTDRYQTDYQKRIDLLKEMDALKKENPDGGEMIAYQLAEIAAAKLSDPEEEAALAQEDRALKNWESILAATEGSYCALAGDGGVLNQLGAIEHHLRSLQNTTQNAQSEIDLLDNAQIALKELGLLLRDRMQGTAYDPDRQNQVTERLHLIQKMKRKYGASIAAILEAARQMELALKRLAERAERIQEAEQTLQNLVLALEKSAAALSGTRKKAMGLLAKKVNEEIAGLGMEKTQFDISMQKKPFSDDGTDVIQFLIALPGEAAKPISRIASGGELSRLMLALKVALTEADPTPTLIFDEIDAGIGGAVAERVGRRLSRLAQYHQVFCITHLPQVARFADHHYLVEKDLSGKRAAVSVRELTREERVSELSRMLGGTTMTATTRRHAEELIASSQGSTD